MQQSREIRQDPQTRLLLCIKLLNDRSNLSLMAQGFALPEDSIVQTREALPNEVDPDRETAGAVF